MESVRGQHEASWLGFYDYFSSICGLKKQTEKLAGLWLVCQNAGWMLPRRNICWISERHNIIRRDDNGQLHCENGLALAYPDGWGIWAIHGVRVDEQIVLHPENQTIRQISSEENAEVKRIRIERFGWTKYLVDAGASVVDHKRDDIAQTDESLMQLDDMRVLVGACPSTARVYAMEVDPACATVAEAQNFLSGGRSARTIGAS